MALLVDDSSGNLVQNLWPDTFKRCSDIPSDYADCLLWQAVPFSDVELSDWLQVVPNPVSGDRSRPYTVTHVPDAEDGEEDGSELYELAVRFSGFLERFNLGTLGTWDGSAAGAVKAVQHVVLSGGGYETQWAATVRALNRILRVVSKTVKPDQDDVSTFETAGQGNVYMQRRVFVKAGEDTSFNIPPDAAHLGPQLNAIGKVWHLDERMEFGQLARDGSLKRATNVIFRHGHYVEVTAYIEVIQNRSGRVRIQLRPDRLVLLSTEGQTKGRIPPITKVKIHKRRAPILDAEAVFVNDSAPMQQHLSAEIPEEEMQE